MSVAQLKLQEPVMATEARMGHMCGPFFPERMDRHALLVAYTLLPPINYDSLLNVFPDFEGFSGSKSGHATKDGYYWPMAAVFNTKEGGEIHLMFPERLQSGSTDRYPAFYVSGPVGSEEIETLAYRVHAALVAFAGRKQRRR